MRSYNERLIQPKISRARGKVFVIPGDKFFIKSSRENCIYYIDALFSEYILIAKQYGAARQWGDYDIVVREVKPSEGTTVDFSKHKLNIVEEDPKWVFQNEIVEEITDNDYWHDILEIQTGQGKALSNDTPLKTPSGWVNMGDINVGDELVSRAGKITHVTGVYPQGDLQLYKITFADGRWLECCAEHLWHVFYINTSAGRRWRTVNTLEVLRLISMPNPRVYIQLAEPMDKPDIELPIKPYTLGVLLGDGGLTIGVKLTTPDAEIVENVTAELPDNLKLVYHGGLAYTVNRITPKHENTYLNKLRELGLIGKKSEYKFIPEIYKTASVRQIKELIQGLIDTDGSVEKAGSMTYCTSSYQLAKDVQELIWSIGGIASISSRIPHYTYKGEYLDGLRSYRVNIRYKKPTDLVRLTKKKVNANDDGQYTNILKLRVSSVVHSRIAPAQCITVDSPDKLFVAKDYIVTHNTALSVKATIVHSKRMLLITKATFLDKWVPDLEEKLNLRAGELIRLKGISSIETLTALADEGKLDGKKTVKAILISSHTLDLYIHEYMNSMHKMCHPLDLLKRWGVGFVVYDESHMLFRMNYWSYMMLNIPKLLDLTATIKPDTEFDVKRMKERFPPERRYNKLEVKVYSDAIGIYFGIKDQRMVQSVNRLRMYNHNEFEKHILKDQKKLDAYFDMCDQLLQSWFFKTYEKGQKFMVFFSSIDMCTKFTVYLDRKYAKFRFARYTQTDKLADALKADGIITTPGKAGTAIDVPGLILTVVTPAVDKTSTNLQIFGRNRQQFKWDKVPTMLYLICRNIPKHQHYHKRRVLILRGRARKHIVLNSNFMI